MADAIQAVPLLPAQRAELEDSVSLPMAELHISDTIQQAQGAFHMQSLLAMVAILALGLFLIYRLVGKALAPLDTLTCRIRERTAADLAQPVEIPDSGDEAAALALAFNQMSQRLNQVFVMQRNFSRNAAHEFRTPLAVLKTRIGLFRKKQDFRPQATLELLQIVEGEVDRLSAMVSELLELTNLERASRGERLSSGQLIRSAADQAAPQAEARSITILVDAAPCTLAGNAELLRQAVCNLVENAVKYSPAGSVVHIAGHRDGEWFQIVVADQGPGIPESLRQRIFEPFFRVDDSRSRQLGGAGLGLALVRAIAEFHGGAVYVEKSRGAGSRFVLKLPCRTGVLRRIEIQLTSFVRRDRRKRLAAVIFMPLAVASCLSVRRPLGLSFWAEDALRREPPSGSLPPTRGGAVCVQTFEDISVSANAIPRCLSIQPCNLCATYSRKAPEI